VRERCALTGYAIRQMVWLGERCDETLGGGLRPACDETYTRLMEAIA